MGKLVDIDLNNLNQKDDKQSTSFINYLPTSSAKKTEKGLKMKKKSLFVTSLAYC